MINFQLILNILLVATVLFLLCDYDTEENDVIEQFSGSDTEAIANVASLYNSNNFTISNMNVSNNATVGNKIENSDVILDNRDLGGPTDKTRINKTGIIFGGSNNNREGNSAQISAGRHDANSLCIVGMSDTNKANRRITMWNEGGLTIYGPTNINSSLKIGNITLQDAGDGSLRISSVNGYVDIGAKNTDHAHIYTDRPAFAFNKRLQDWSSGGNGNGYIRSWDTTGLYNSRGWMDFGGGVGAVGADNSWSRISIAMR